MDIESTSIANKTFPATMTESYAMIDSGTSLLEIGQSLFYLLFKVFL